MESGHFLSCFVCLLKGVKCGFGCKLIVPDADSGKPKGWDLYQCRVVLLGLSNISNIRLYRSLHDEIPDKMPENVAFCLCVYLSRQQVYWVS